MIPTIGHNFDKTKTNRVGSGYFYRVPIAYKSIIIHTTNGAPNSLFTSEANFLQKSKDVSAHFLVGKQGLIEQILDTRYMAWHAGKVRDSRYNNQNAIGIEVHFTPVEGSWTAEQQYALTWLVNQLLVTHGKLEIVTHRYAAVPPGRKIDPSGFSDNAFRFWRDNIMQDWTLVKTLFVGNMRTSPNLANNIARKIPINTTLNAFKTKGEFTNGSDVWYATTEGYIHSSVVKEVR